MPPARETDRLSRVPRTSEAATNGLRDEPLNQQPHLGPRCCTCRVSLHSVFLFSLAYLVMFLHNNNELSLIHHDKGKVVKLSPVTIGPV